MKLICAETCDAAFARRKPFITAVTEYEPAGRNGEVARLIRLRISANIGADADDRDGCSRNYGPSRFADSSNQSSCCLLRKHSTCISKHLMVAMTGRDITLSFTPQVHLV